MMTIQGGSGEEPARRAMMLPALVGFGLIVLAALLLWLRFGTAIFLDSLSAVWSCF